MGVELVLSPGFSDIGPERDFPGVLDQRGPNWGGPGKSPRRKQGREQGRGVQGKSPSPNFPQGQGFDCLLR